MGGFLTQPVTVKECNHGKGLGLRYGLSSMQGWRPEMEDAHDLQIGLDYGLDDWSFFAVFDGHAGKHTSCHASHHLLDHILKDQEFKLNTSRKKITDTSHETTRKSQDKTNKPNEESLQTFNDEAKFDSYRLEERVKMVQRAIRSGFLTFDKTMRADRKDLSGSTAICAFISPTHLFIANCGDSRAVLYDGNGQPKFASIDHKPLNPTERRRIINAGGIASDRVNGQLAVSRSLGDFEFKKDLTRGPCDQLVSPEPEITAIERTAADQFLILACDGIWDVISNKELCEYVEYHLMIESNLEIICSNVIDICLRRRSRDNMSIIIVVFENAPKLNLEFVEQIKKDDEYLVNLLEKFLEKEPRADFSRAIDCLESQACDLDVYQSRPFGGIVPPGVGLLAKYDFLFEKFEQFSQAPKSEMDPEQVDKQQANSN